MPDNPRTPESLVRDALAAHYDHALLPTRHCDDECWRYLLAHAPLAETLARGLAAPALVETLTDMVGLALSGAAKAHLDQAGVMQDPPHGWGKFADCEAPWCVRNQKRLAAARAALAQTDPPASPGGEVDGVSLPITVRLSLAQMGTWSPSRISRFFSGVATMLYAINDEADRWDR